VPALPPPVPPAPVADPPVPPVPVASMHALFVQVWLEVQQAVPHGVVPPAQLDVHALLLQT
jgi:hypothetical protein